ncbi:MAG: hypothetical protein WCI11_09175 [Candidatus Methylumidiphilus sp.]
MSKKLIPILADAIREYYNQEELLELCETFDIQLDPEHFYSNNFAYMKFAKKLIFDSDLGETRYFLDAFIPSLTIRCSSAQVNANYEFQEYHFAIERNIKEFSSFLNNSKVPNEITITENQPFTAKSHLREFLEKAVTPITVVDAYIGIRTLDCLRDVNHPIRVITGVKSNSIEAGFERAIQEFKDEGHGIEVKKHNQLHDRYVLFNERCWLIGSSLKDAGKKTLNVIEIFDVKSAIIDEVERKWSEATAF